MALCTDAVLRNGEVVGDPTEGALVVLAEKGGIDVTALREEHPRQLEIPFDSDYKFMATFHRWTGERGREVVRCFLKGAPDAISTSGARNAPGRRAATVHASGSGRPPACKTSPARRGGTG